MIFLCFAVVDRIPLVNDFYQFLGNFGLDIWYDRRNIFWGDNRYQSNIQEGVANKNIRYAVVFYSDNFAAGKICLEEFKIISERYNAGELHIFPVFLCGVPHEIPDSFSLCTHLVYKTLSGPEDFYGIALHILAKITNDRVALGNMHTIQDILLNYKDKNSLLYTLLKEYDNIEKRNYSMRIGSLFNIYAVATHGKEPIYMDFKTINYIYHRACVSDLREEKRELQVMENIIVYTVGSIL